MLLYKALTLPGAFARSIGGLPAATRPPDGPRRIESREASPATPGTPSGSDISAVGGWNRFKSGMTLREMYALVAVYSNCNSEVLAGTAPDAASDRGVTRARRIGGHVFRAAVGLPRILFPSGFLSSLPPPSLYFFLLSPFSFPSLSLFCFSHFYFILRCENFLTRRTL